MSNYIFYGITIVLLVISIIKDKNKTKMALKKAWKSFDNILPDMLFIITIIGVLVTVINPETISQIIGEKSGITGLIVSILTGSIALIPGFIAFPTAAILLENGAGYMQIAGFISSLMMVGVVTLPLEIKYFGKRATIARNVLAVAFSFIVAIIVGSVMM